MGIASFSQHFSRTPALSVLLTPLQSLAAWFEPVHPAAAVGNGQAGQALQRRPGGKPVAQVRGGLAANTELWDASRSRAAVHSGFPAPRLEAALSPKPTCSRLKIVRTFEPGTARSCAGRMVISGRMADVCDELDRMAAR